MNGIPLKIMRAGVEETVYLSTRRSGEAGGAMRAAVRRYTAACLTERRAQARIALITVAVGKIPDDAEKFADTLTAVANDMDTLICQASSAREAAVDAACEAVRLSLAENHGDDAEAIIDCLTDAQLEKSIAIIQTGETPADFFPSRATPPNPSDTTPSADGGGASS